MEGGGREEFLLGFACKQIGIVLMGKRWAGGGGKSAVFYLYPQCNLGEERVPWVPFLIRLHKALGEHIILGTALK